MPGAPTSDAPRRAPTLRSRLTLAFALSSGLPLLVILPIASRYAGRAYEERALSELEAARALAQERIEVMPREIHGDLEKLLDDDRVRKDLEDDALLLRLMSAEEPCRALDLDAVFVIDAAGRYVVNSLAYGNTGLASADALVDFDRALHPAAPVRRLEALPDGGRAVLLLAAKDVGTRRVVAARALGPRFLEALGDRYPMIYLLASRPTPPFSDAIRAPGDRRPLPATDRELESLFLARTIPVAVGSGPVQHLAILRSQEDLWVVRRNLLGLFALLFGLALALSWVTGYVLAERIASPVHRLVDAFAEVAGGNLDVRVDTADAPAEIRQMGDAFNRMATDLRENKQRLLRAERIAAWEEIARRLAHEIKNPLSPIRLAIENCRKAYDRKLPEFDEIFREASVAVLEEVDKLRRIVEEFSLFARLPKPSLTQQDLGDVVQSIAKLHAGTGRATVRAITDTRVPPFLFDQDQIHRVLMNLVQNALDASPEGGEVVVAARLADDGRHAEISVSDQGAGIEPQVRNRLFTPYVTTKARGTGLGLAISARIVEEHGGRVDVVPRDPGTTFVVSLPLREAASAPAPPAPPAA